MKQNEEKDKDNIMEENISKDSKSSAEKLQTDLLKPNDTETKCYTKLNHQYAHQLCIHCFVIYQLHLN